MHNALDQERILLMVPLTVLFTSESCKMAAEDNWRKMYQHYATLIVVADGQQLYAKLRQWARDQQWKKKKHRKLPESHIELLNNIDYNSNAIWWWWFRSGTLGMLIVAQLVLYQKLWGANEHHSTCMCIVFTPQGQWQNLKHLPCYFHCHPSCAPFIGRTTALIWESPHSIFFSSMWWSSSRMQKEEAKSQWWWYSTKWWTSRRKEWNSRTFHWPTTITPKLHQSQSMEVHWLYLLQCNLHQCSKLFIFLLEFMLSVIS